MEVGDVVADRFHLEGVAGTGGMGVVYRARDRASGAQVALKAVRAARSGVEERFAREATLLANLAHASIVRYVAHGVHQRESWLAMEWLEGEDLAARLGRGRLDVADALAVATQAAAGLAAAHARGVVHRDVKPANLFLAGGSFAAVRVLDFGIARLVDATRGLTGTGVMIGTPGYVSPEQARGGDVDARADVFALGCVLFECITGRPAFTGNNVMALLAKILLEDPPRVRDVRADVPADVDELVARMMAKEPSERFNDAGEVVSALAECAARVASPATSLASAAPSSAPAGASPTAPSSRAVIAGREQRLQCVLLIGTTRADSGVLAPHDATEAGDDVGPRLARAAAAHGGSANVLADGSVVVTFALGFAGGFAGSAHTAADVATRAARAALALHAFAPDTPIVLASGRSELSERTPTGEVIDRAADVLQWARDERAAVGTAERTVLVDDVTAGLLGVSFELVRNGDSAPWRLLAEREALAESRLLVGKPTRCRGRDGELAMLAALQAASAAESTARVVLVTAGAGAGKSRLSRELIERIRRTDGGDVTLLFARADPMSAGSLFGLAGQLLRRAAGFLEGEAPAARIEKLSGYLARLGPDAVDDAAREILGELTGAPSVREPSAPLRAARADPALMGERMRAAWSAWLAAECKARPVVVVLEDLHWGDLPSVQLVDGALEALADQPLFVVALARPEVHDRFPRLWAGRELQELRLPAIGKRAAEALVKDVLGDSALADDVVRIVDRAGGNAFFLEELIRAVAEGRGGALPETLVAMMQSRLDVLDEASRRALRAASVFGEAFTRGGVAHLLGGVAGDAIDDLVARELVERRTVSRFAGENELVFRHGLLRDAAYATLVDDDRLVAHRLAADWLEAHGERDPVVLAAHLERAREPARALPFIVRAAERAIEGYDLDATLDFVKRGESCGAGGQALASLRAAEMNAQMWRGDYVRAEVAAIDVMQLAPAGDPLWYSGASATVFLAGFTGNAEAFLATLSAVREQPFDGAIGVPQVHACVNAMGACSLMGQRDVVAHLAAKLEAAAAARRLDVATTGWLDLARFVQLDSATTDLAAQIVISRRAVANLTAGGDRHGLNVASQFLGVALSAAGAFAEAERIQRDGIGWATRSRARLMVPLGRAYFMITLIRRGADLEACAVAERSLAEGLPLGAHAESSMRMHHGLALMNLGRDDEALAEANRAIDLSVFLPRNRSWTLALLARLHQRAGRSADARAAAAEARALVREFGGTAASLGRVSLSIAEVLLANDVDEGRAALRDARASVHERARNLEPLGLAESFLAVSENARILELSRQWLEP